MSIMLVLSCIIALVAGSYPRDLLLGRRHRGLSAEGGDVEDGDKRVYPRQSTGARFTFYDTGLGACGVYNKSTDFVSHLFLFVVQHSSESLTLSSQIVALNSAVVFFLFLVCGKLI